MAFTHIDIDVNSITVQSRDHLFYSHFTHLRSEVPTEGRDKQELRDVNSGGTAELRSDPNSSLHIVQGDRRNPVGGISGAERILEASRSNVFLCPVIIIVSSSSRH